MLVSKLEKHGFDGWTTLWIKTWMDGHSCGQWLIVHTKTSGACQGSVLGLIQHLYWWHGEWDQPHPQQICWRHQAVWCCQHAGGTGCHPEGPWQDIDVGCANFMEFYKGSTPGSRQSLTHQQAGQRSDWEQLCRERLGGDSWRKSTWASSACSQPRKPDGILGCIKRSMANMSKEVILHLYSALVGPHPQYYTQFWVPNIRRTGNC